ncbi:hypothetical protein [Allomuricauda sp. F6463D]|uniref:hypothetical protein n=1 Tax=Allomuricauda sp. F6463D TaxID=2926409 RepID=UPI001FF5653E|nr:hypothetical protein [Muricauda sp. F6463D]MCK0159909.1 hypothetical protein [Muricauda sp. F6463D]
MKKNKKNSFDIPEGYFESFNDRLMDRIKKEEAENGESLIPKSDGFTVPNSYFDNVEPVVLSKTVKKETKVVPLRPNSNFYYGAAAVAAIFILIFSFNWNSTSETIGFDDLANAEIEAYLDNNTYGMSSYEIASIIPIDDLSFEDVLENALEENNILEYLDENVDDIEDLNLDYSDYE